MITGLYLYVYHIIVHACLCQHQLIVCLETFIPLPCILILSFHIHVCLPRGLCPLAFKHNFYVLAIISVCSTCSFPFLFFILSSQKGQCRSHWPRGLRRGSAAARLLKLWVRIPAGAWTSVCCECCVLTGRGLCDELITRPEEALAHLGLLRQLNKKGLQRLQIIGYLVVQFFLGYFYFLSLKNTFPRLIMLSLAEQGVFCLMRENQLCGRTEQQ